ncbi:MAG: sulfatase-like hydrolase/transferase [Rhodospirillales bacterium]|nr:sulfatase-like hydrolase/transferase [Rhodospirillales bacterium]
MADRPNILFIMSDQHAPRVTGCYGDKIVRTPNLDGLAARGVIFENAYTPSPLCVPARMSLLSGRYPSSQHCWTNSDPLDSDIPTTAHALGAGGYRPNLIGRLHSIGPDQMHGYAERQVGDHSTNWVGGIAHSLGVLAKTEGPFRVSLERSGAGQSAYEVHDRDVTADALKALEQLAEARKGGDSEPFSLNIGYMLPHQPYVANKELVAYYLDKIAEPTYDKPAPGTDHPYMKWWREMTGIDTDINPLEVRRARAAYYALTETFDTMVGQVLAKLQELGLAENTLIVYTSDHGDQIGERGLWWKQTFYDDSCKVPMILSWPGVFPEGQRRKQIVNLIDLAATVLDAANAPALPNIDGRSFLPVIHNASAPWLDETYSEYCTDGMAAWAQGIPTQQRMIRAGKWKLNYYHGHPPQMFDLETDPGEINDLGLDPDKTDIRDHLQAKVLTHWDPEAIKATMADRRARKELLGKWSQAIKPQDTYRWQFKMEDNWLDNS